MSTVQTSRSPAPETVAVERVDRCPQCRAFTYDVNGLTEEEIRRLVLETEGRVLTNLVSRRDGRVMSVDCGHARASSNGRRVAFVGLVLVILAVAFFAVRHRPVEPPPAPHDLVGEAPLSVPEEPFAPLAPVEHEPLFAELLSVRIVREAEVESPSIEEEVRPHDHTNPANLDVYFANVSSVGAAARLPAREVLMVLEASRPRLQECYLDLLGSMNEYRGAAEVTAVVNANGGCSSCTVDGAVVVPVAKDGRTQNRALTPVRQQLPAALKECVKRSTEAMLPIEWASRTVSFKVIFNGWK